MAHVISSWRSIRVYGISIDGISSTELRGKRKNWRGKEKWWGKREKKWGGKERSEVKKEGSEGEKMLHHWQARTHNLLLTSRDAYHPNKYLESHLKYLKPGCNNSMIFFVGSCLKFPRVLMSRISSSFYPTVSSAYLDQI